VISVAHPALGVCQVGLGDLDVVVEVGSVVVHSVLRHVVPLVLGLLGSEVPLVLHNVLSLVEAVQAGLNLTILAEVRDWIVDRVSRLLVSVLELGAASRGADGIALKSEVTLSHSQILRVPLAQSAFGLLGVGKRISNIVVHAEVGHVVAGGRRRRLVLIILDDPLVLESRLSLLDVGEGVLNILVDSEVRYIVVNGMALRSLERGLSPDVSGALLSILEVALGGQDVVVHTEVGHEVVLGVTLGLLEGSGGPLVLEVLFSLLGMSN